MSDGPSAYETLRREEELARARRWRHGADTTLDDAKVRHDAIFDMVYAHRFWGPMKYPVLLGWVTPLPSFALLDWIAGIVCVFVGYVLAGAVRSTTNGLIGKFKPLAGIKAENAVVGLCGIAVAIVGAGLLSLGTVIGGVAMVLMPFTWRGWACRRMARTDYSRLKAAQVDPGPPLIME